MRGLGVRISLAAPIKSIGYGNEKSVAVSYRYEIGTDGHFSTGTSPDPPKNEAFPFILGQIIIPHGKSQVSPECHLVSPADWLISSAQLQLVEARSE